MRRHIHRTRRIVLLAALPMLAALLIAAPARADTEQDAGGYNASGDYITDCKYATCVGMAGSEWSEKHPFGVAVSVRMGTRPAVTDDQIKMVLTRDFEHYGVTQIRFFYEQNDVPASVMKLHVRGGTEGPFVIDDVRQHVRSIADRAKNENPALISKGFDR